MSDITTNIQDGFREVCIRTRLAAGSVAHGFGRVGRRLGREARGQTAAEYMGVLFVVSVIIAAVATTGVGDDIRKFIGGLVEDIAQGRKGDGGKAGN